MVSILSKIRRVYEKAKPYVPYVLAGLAGMPVGMVVDTGRTVKFGKLELTETTAEKQLFLRIDSEKGYHALPGTLLLKQGSKFASEIRIHNKDGASADIKDFMDVVSEMTIEKGDLVVITFEGNDALEAKAAIKAVIEKLRELPEPEVWTFLSLKELENELFPGKASRPVIPPPVVPDEVLPAGFLRGSSGNCCRIVEGETAVISDQRTARAYEDYPVAADEAGKLMEAVASVSNRLKRILEENHLGEESATARNLMLLQHFSGAVLRIVREEGVGTAAAAKLFFEKYKAGNGLIEDMRAIMEDVLATRYGGIDEVLAQIDTGRQGKVILVVPTLTPLTALRIVENSEKILGVAVEKRLNPESHQVILLDDAGIPVVTGLTGLTSAVKSGDQLILDSAGALVITDLASREASAYFVQRSREQRVLDESVVSPSAEEKATTLDGAGIGLLINIEMNEELLGMDFPGVGLRRSEFALIKNRDGSMRESEPSFMEMVEDYAQMLRICQGRVAVLRAFDFEPTKFPKYLDQKLIYQAMEAGPEIYLAYDGTKKTLKFEVLNYLFRKQIRAFLLATGIVAQELNGGIAPALMFPMISNADRFSRAFEIVGEERERLRRQNEEFFKDVKIGAMVELPSAARDAERLALRADFLSIGTNDLKAATFVELGERDAKEVSRTIEGLPPQVLNYVKMSAEAAQRNGKPVSCCGMLAGSSRHVPLLIGAGVDHLSVPRGQLGKITFMLKNITLNDSQNLVTEALALGTAQEVEKILGRRIEELMGSAWAGLKPLHGLIFRERSVREIIAQGGKIG